jgi:hypothetical protein
MACENWSGSAFVQEAGSRSTTIPLSDATMTLPTWQSIHSQPEPSLGSTGFAIRLQAAGSELAVHRCRRLGHSFELREWHDLLRARAR